ncbi:centromere protein X-like isoform X3 [Ostrea edulis]|uniref:centromere protein X-like isoform X3 n=1 Tax=Ostrea edulis TaxID=37623 RepID=UPI0024AF025C|nr:centromere protein X-like isoform X3 [Ostrea edulis]
MSASGGANFKERTVQNILLHFFREENTKVNAEALSLITELLKIFVSEAVLRTIREGKVHAYSFNERSSRSNFIRLL